MKATLLTLSVLTAALVIPSGSEALTGTPSVVGRSAPTSCRSLEIIAHRGYHTGPANDENTLGSFKKAAKRHYSIETDVWPDAQGNLWIFHDRNVFKATGVHGYINEMSTARVAKLRYKKAGSRLPRLKHAVAVWAAHPRTRVYLEVKVQSSVADVARVVRRSGNKGHVYFTSFTNYVHRTQPDLKLLFKSYEFLPDPAALRRRSVDVVAFQPRQITTRTVNRYHAVGIEVQDRETTRRSEWRSVIRAGADGILTDLPNDLKEFCPRA